MLKSVPGRTWHQFWALMLYRLGERNNVLWKEKTLHVGEKLDGMRMTILVFFFSGESTLAFWLWATENLTSCIRAVSCCSWIYFYDIERKLVRKLENLRRPNEVERRGRTEKIEREKGRENKEKLQTGRQVTHGAIAQQAVELPLNLSRDSVARGHNPPAICLWQEHCSLLKQWVPLEQNS